MGKKIFTQARGECKEAGKKMYCKDCEKSIDYFEVFENNQSKTTTLIHIIKAYTWNDVIKFVKDKYFKDQDNLLIDCEKEFAFLEKQNKSDKLLTEPVEQSTIYKICLRNENDLSINKNTSILNMLIDLTKNS
jgi:hypothetical protein